MQRCNVVVASTEDDVMIVGEVKCEFVLEVVVHLVVCVHVVAVRANCGRQSFSIALY